MYFFGAWPSGKATGFGPVIGGSNPSAPAILRQGYVWHAIFLMMKVNKPCIYYMAYFVIKIFMDTIIIRSFNLSDFPVVIQLFKEAVPAINIKHYSSQQISTWIDIDLTRWQEKLINNIALVAEINSIIVGFIDMTHEGYLDHLYIHKDYQARWVSLKLLRAIEKTARQLGFAKIVTDCSITAKIPAERVGFRVIKEQIVE